MPDAPFAPGPVPRTVRTPAGGMQRVPDGWELLPPGDAALTRRVKAAGETWAVAEKRGRKLFSRGVWAPAGHIRAAEAELAAERADPAHAKRKLADAARRGKAQDQYAGDFAEAVRAFLAFHPAHADLAGRLSGAIAAHATPVGSGTVARTKRIPVEDRARAATIAWLRHATTAYDRMSIARVKGKAPRGAARPRPRLGGAPGALPARRAGRGRVPPGARPGRRDPGGSGLTRRAD